MEFYKFANQFNTIVIFAVFQVLAIWGLSSFILELFKWCEKQYCKFKAKK